MDLVELVWPMLLVVIGLGLLIQGGNYTIDSAVYIAKRFGISPMIVGFTILAFGTSLPELIVSILAVLRGSAGIAMGNVIGSNIANILMVIGVAALIATMHVKINKALAKDFAMMLVSTVILAAFMVHGQIGSFAGGAMLALLFVYVFMQYRGALRGEVEVEIEVEAEHDYKRSWQPYIFSFDRLDRCSNRRRVFGARGQSKRSFNWCA